MTSCLVLGIDPGFASLGFALVRLAVDRAEVVDLGVIMTEASDKKRRVLAAEDNARRAMSISRATRALINRDDVRCVCAESMSFPRNASASAKMGMSWGVLFAQIEQRELPLLQASPQEVKLAACGKKTASKEEVQEAMLKLYGRHLAPLVAGRYPRGEAEHAFDALAVVHTSLSTDTVKTMRSMMR